MEGFAFSLGDKVTILASEEKGAIIGRAEYTNETPQYLVRYRAADGRATELWWHGDALVKVE